MSNETKERTDKEIGVFRGVEDVFFGEGAAVILLRCLLAPAVRQDRMRRYKGL